MATAVHHRREKRRTGRQAAASQTGGGVLSTESAVTVATPRSEPARSAGEARSRWLRAKSAPTALPRQTKTALAQAKRDMISATFEAKRSSTRSPSAPHSAMERPGKEMKDRPSDWG